MPDVYATIAEADEATQQRLAEILELRAADPQQQAMVDSYLSRIGFGPEAHVLEIGCGTGAVTRAVARRDGVAHAIGVDPSPVFVAKAAELAAGLTNVEFVVGDGRALHFDDGDFDTVVVHTTLCHVPQPESLLGEAMRVLRPGGTLAICDGDYATITVAVGDFDPLQACIEAVKAAFINDVWLVRRLPAMLRTAGFELARDAEPRLPADLRTCVHADARRPGRRRAGRVGAPRAGRGSRAQGGGAPPGGAGEFFGFIAFASFIARKPSTRSLTRRVTSSSADPTAWVAALRTAHDRLAAFVDAGSAGDLAHPSMCSEWSVAQVLSHLGSGAEIFFAVVTETPVDNQEVWARWNAKHAADMAASFVPADEKLVAWFEALSPDELTTRQIQLPFLPAPISAVDSAGFRLSEVALHSWDVFASFDDLGGRGARCDAGAARPAADDGRLRRPLHTA